MATKQNTFGGYLPPSDPSNATTIRARLSGDHAAARELLRNVVRSIVPGFTQASQFQSIQQTQKVITYPTGETVRLRNVFGLIMVDIHVPQHAAPKPAAVQKALSESRAIKFYSRFSISMRKTPSGFTDAVHFVYDHSNDRVVSSFGGASFSFPCLTQSDSYQNWESVHPALASTEGFHSVQFVPVGGTQEFFTLEVPRHGSYSDVFAPYEFLEGGGIYLSHADAATSADELLPTAVFYDGGGQYYSQFQAGTYSGVTGVYSNGDSARVTSKSSVSEVTVRTYGSNHCNKFNQCTGVLQESMYIWVSTTITDTETTNNTGGLASSWNSLNVNVVSYQTASVLHNLKGHSSKTDVTETKFAHEWDQATLEYQRQTHIESTVSVLGTEIVDSHSSDDTGTPAYVDTNGFTSSFSFKSKCELDTYGGVISTPVEYPWAFVMLDYTRESHQYAQPSAFTNYGFNCKAYTGEFTAADEDALDTVDPITSPSAALTSAFLSALELFRITYGTQVTGTALSNLTIDHTLYFVQAQWNG